MEKEEKGKRQVCGNSYEKTSRSKQISFIENIPFVSFFSLRNIFIMLIQISLIYMSRIIPKNQNIGSVIAPTPHARFILVWEGGIKMFFLYWILPNNY